MRRLIPILLSSLLGALTVTASAHADVDTGQVVVRYRDRQAVMHYADAAAARRALPGLRRRPGVVAAGPRFIARVADFDDTGVAVAAGTPGGWQAVEWDLLGPFGINVPGAWTAAAGLGARGGDGVTVAVVDTGVAYSNRPPYRRSPDLPARRMRSGYDFVSHDAFPNDRSGHGTFVASAIAAAADNHFGMVGVAYRADIMPVRVLDSLGEGSSGAIASGVRYAVDHGAQVVNLSVEFFDLLSGRPYTITSSPDVRDAIRYAGEHRVPVVVAAGNSSEAEIPSRVLDDSIIYVGATTEHGCLADYSNFGPWRRPRRAGRRRGRVAAQRSQLRAGRQDRAQRPAGQLLRAPLRRVPDPARPEGADRPEGHLDGRPARHGRRRPAARGEASLGPNPTTQQIARRLTETARDLGPPGPDRYYAAGLVDAAAALRGTKDRKGGAPRRRLSAFGTPQVVLMISTLQGAWWLTLFGTEPSRKRLAPVMPLLPTTMRSAPRSSATSRMASAGSPWRA